MTMTDVRPPAAVDAPAVTAARATGHAHRPAADPRFVKELIATAALAGFSVAVGVGFARVFSGWQFLDDYIAMAVVGHGLGFALRRLRVSGWIAVPAVFLTLTWVIGFVHYRDSFSFLLPTAETLDLLRFEIDRVREEFRTAVAPVIFAGGWDVIAAVGMGLTIALSDAFAFRAFARAEALVPGGVLFIFISALGFDRLRVASTALLVAAGVVATVALRAHHGPNRTAAIGRRRSATRLVVPGAVGTAVVVAAIASWVGPRVPGADSEPIYETRGGNGGTVTNVVSPLVDIRSRLTNRSNAQMFVVDASFESYWRSSALPRFDGTTWGLPERALTTAEGELSAARAGADTLIQEIRIVGLGGRFIPTAADPVAASPQEGLRWNADSATLLKTDGDLESGEIYTVESASPRFEVADLRAASSTDAGDPIYLELPAGFPEIVGATAREVTASVSTSYDAAIALQTWFRTEFDYSLEVQAGHSNTAVEGFLRDRVGYCEQFAGTFAAMMRTLGIPARVAVGFTPGNETAPNSYSVLGKNAHAWPEVWFDGLGWVPFEPTPGRGAPGAQNYTGVAPEQDVTGVDPGAPTAEPTEDSIVDDASPIPTTTNSAGETAFPGLPDNLELEPEGSGAAEPTTEPASSVPWPTLITLAAIAMALALPALVRRWRRRQRQENSVHGVAIAWRRAVDSVNEIGVRFSAANTPTELADQAGTAFPAVARPMAQLAETVTEVSYAPDGVADATSDARAAECRRWARQIERSVNDVITPLARVRRHFTRWS